MRFNDMIATVLAASAERPEARDAQWRQLVDLLAQPQPGSTAERDAGFAFLRAERPAVEPAVRANAGASLAGLAIDPELVVFFAEDRAEIAAPLLRSARLRSEDWLAILPRLGPTARALVRHRQDLPRDARRALAAFGPVDLVLERGGTPEVSQTDIIGENGGGSQIRDLVERIEAYQRRRRDPDVPAEHADLEISAFHWETGVEGVIQWVDEAPRGPLIGLSMAALDDVDAETIAAFEARTPFRDARMRIAGDTAAAGDWHISGVPFYDRERGAFLGYRGGARRSQASGPASTPFGPDLPPDSLRQLVHELRTPLNAIMGFAELIEGEFMGPAAMQYRDRATDIMTQARRLLLTVDDLDTAARIETQRLDVAHGHADLVAILDRLAPSYEAVARNRGARLMIHATPGLPDVGVSQQDAERLLARLLAATVGLGEAGEQIRARMKMRKREGKMMPCFSIDRPRIVDGLNEGALLDPAYSPAVDWPTAPSLGLGFALNLVRKLAQAHGGDLLIADNAVHLLLPAAIGDRS